MVQLYLCFKFYLPLFQTNDHYCKWYYHVPKYINIEPQHQHSNVLSTVFFTITDVLFLFIYFLYFVFLFVCFSKIHDLYCSTSLIYWSFRSVSVYVARAFWMTPQWSGVCLRSWCVGYDPCQGTASLLIISPTTQSILKITGQNRFPQCYTTTCIKRKSKV